MTSMLLRCAAVLLLGAGCTAPLILAEPPQDDVVPFAPEPRPTTDASQDAAEDASTNDDGSGGGISNIEDGSREDG